MNRQRNWRREPPYLAHQAPSVENSLRDLEPLMLDRHPDLAERHVLRWLGGKAEFLKA